MANRAEENTVWEENVHHIVSWLPLFEALKDSGLLPDYEHTSCVVIDAEVGKPCRMTIYRFADERISVVGGAIQIAKDASDGVVR